MKKSLHIPGTGSKSSEAVGEPVLTQRGIDQTLVQAETLVASYDGPENLYLHVMPAKTVRWDEKTSPKVLKGMGTTNPPPHIMLAIGGKPGAYRVSMTALSPMIQASHVNEEFKWVGENPKLYYLRTQIMPVWLQWVSNNQQELDTNPIVSFIDAAENVVSLSFYNLHARLQKTNPEKELVKVQDNTSPLPFIFLRHPEEHKTRAPSEINGFVEPGHEEKSSAPLLFDGQKWMPLSPMELRLSVTASVLIAKIEVLSYADGMGLVANTLSSVGVDNGEQDQALAELAALAGANLPPLITPLTAEIMMCAQELICKNDYPKVASLFLSYLYDKTSTYVDTDADRAIHAKLKRAKKSKEIPLDYFLNEIVLSCEGQDSPYQNMIEQITMIFVKYAAYYVSADALRDCSQEVERKANKHSNQGAVCFKDNNFNKACHHFKMSLSCAQLIYAHNHSDLGKAYHNMGATLHESYLKNPEQKPLLMMAREYLKCAYDIRAQNGEAEPLSKTLKRLKEIESALSEQDSAKEPQSRKKHVKHA